MQARIAISDLADAGNCRQFSMSRRMEITIVKPLVGRDFVWKAVEEVECAELGLRGLGRDARSLRSGIRQIGSGWRALENLSRCGTWLRFCGPYFCNCPGLKKLALRQHFLYPPNLRAKAPPNRRRFRGGRARIALPLRSRLLDPQHQTSSGNSGGLRRAICTCGTNKKLCPC